MRVLWSAGRRLTALVAVVVTLAGCASLAVTRCDTIEDRDGKYFGRFFLGVATLGLSEVTIQQEEVRQAYEGSPSCPPPAGVKVVTAAKPASAGGQSAAVATLVNGTRWTIGLYLNQEPGTPGVAPFAILRPSGNLQVAFRPGQHTLLARPTGAPPGTLPTSSGAGKWRSTRAFGASSSSSTRRISSRRSTQRSAFSNQRCGRPSYRQTMRTRSA